MAMRLTELGAKNECAGAGQQLLEMTYAKPETVSHKNLALGPRQTGYLDHWS